MPITRRRRVNSPEQPSEANNQVLEQDEQNTLATENAAIEQGPTEENPESDAQRSPVTPPPTPTAFSGHTEQLPLSYQPLTQSNVPLQQEVNGERASSVTDPSPAAAHPLPARPERVARGETRHDYSPLIEGGRRTARGELFRRPPQQPLPAPTPSPLNQPALQPPSHEISLPMGNLLHLAYNPGYTGSDEARSALLQKLANESKAGGRARCWSCGSLAIVYDRWNTRSKTFGEVGVAFCEICGVWSVM